MIVFLCYLFFVILTFLSFKFLYTKEMEVRVPYSSDTQMRCDGPELLFIFILSTGIIGLTPVLSVRLAILEVLCVLGILKTGRRPIISYPFIIFAVFLLWTLIGIFYTKSPIYGVRMVLKYVYPLLLALFASSVVRKYAVIKYGLICARILALISVVILSIPSLQLLAQCFLWNRSAIATNYITMCMFSLALVFMSGRKKMNLLLAAVFAIVPFCWVFRTDIMGMMIALSTFFLIKYRLKALPIIAAIGIISVCTIFYIPAVKDKMFFTPEEVTLTDFLTNKMDKANINTSGRKTMWEDVQKKFVEGHELTGSGTGRVQTFMYTEVDDWRRSGQIHNDFLVLQADNGYIGVGLYVISYLAMLLHCAMLYYRSKEEGVRLCALVAGSSLIGVMATMYSDNTISYSMSTLSYPWAIYGAVLGMRKFEV